jgi:hypothetical protein
MINCGEYWITLEVIELVNDLEKEDLKENLQNTGQGWEISRDIFQ